MDERAQEKLHKESLKGIIDSITLKKREANGLHQVHNPILNAEKMLFLTTGKHDGTEKSLRDVNRRNCTQVQNPKSWNDTEKRRFRPLDSEF